MAKHKKDDTSLNVPVKVSVSPTKDIRTYVNVDRIIMDREVPLNLYTLTIQLPAEDTEVNQAIDALFDGAADISIIRKEKV